MRIAPIVVLALATQGSGHVVEKVPWIPHPWKQVDMPLIVPRQFPLSVVLKQTGDPDGFAPTVTSGGRLSLKEVSSYRQASNESVKLVSDWLDENNYDNTFNGLDRITFNITSNAAQDFLHATMAPVRYHKNEEVLYRATEYSIPDYLKDHVDFIHPLSNFMAPKRDPLAEHTNKDIREKLEKQAKQNREPLPDQDQRWKQQRRKNHFKLMREHIAAEEATPSNSTSDDGTDAKANKKKLWEKGKPMPYWDTQIHPEDDGDPEEEAETFEEEILKAHEQDNEGISDTEIQYNEELLRQGRKGTLCEWRTTPECLRSQYEMPAFMADTPAESKVRLGLAGAFGTDVNWEDLALFAFERARALPYRDQQGKITGENFKGDKNKASPKIGGREVMIDLQYGYTLAHPHDIIYYTSSVGVEEGNDNEPYLDLLDHMLRQPEDKLPHVLAIPYAESEQLVGRQYAERICRYLGLLTARGVTIVTSSGDGGSAGATSYDSCYNFGYNVIMASFPATCPWVTSVGGVNTKPDITPCGQSGGGYSAYFPRPFWQNKLLGEYEQRLDEIVKKDKRVKTPPIEHYQNTMRGVPDLSVIAKRFLPSSKGWVKGWPKIFIHHTYEMQHGLTTTTGAAVIFAAMVTHENERRVRNGTDVHGMGWLNKRLYEDVPSSMFQDVTHQNTFTCTRIHKHKFFGWIAVPGWDAATGRGAPWGMGMFDFIK